MPSPGSHQLRIRTRLNPKAGPIDPRRNPRFCLLLLYGLWIRLQRCLDVVAPVSQSGRGWTSPRFHAESSANTLQNAAQLYGVEQTGRSPTNVDGIDQSIGKV